MSKLLIVLFCFFFLKIDWTSADAAGLPILPGLVKYEEVANGSITHAVRFTTERASMAFTSPARHV